MPTGVYLRKPLSEETKRRISKSNTGKIRTLEHLKSLSEGHKTATAITTAITNIKAAHKANTGKIFSIERRTKISEWQTRRYEDVQERIKSSERQKGDKANNWKGGKTKESKLLRSSMHFKLWREAVFKKDSWTCQQCGYKGKHLHPHHIKAFADFPELRFAIDNGVTLCASCHQEKHKTLRLSEVANG